MIHVVHIIQMLSHGGAARAFLAVAKYSARLGSFQHHAISLLPADAGGLALAKEVGVTVTNAPDRASLLHELAQADIVHVNFWNNPDVYELLRSNLPAMRLLLWFHVAGDKPPQILTPELIHFADFALACSPHTYEHPAIQGLPSELRAEKTGMVYGATDFARLAGFQPKPHASFNVGYIGTVDFVKMHPRYVSVSAAINIPNVRFVVCGGGMENVLRQQAQQLGIADRFDFRGYVSDVRGVIEILDVYGYPLCPDTYAASELNLQEVMYAGVPPVVFPYGGVKRLVEHNQTGLIVQSEGEYKEAVEHLYRHPDERARLGQNAREYARQFFGAENAALALNPIYNRMMERPKRKRVWGARADIPLLEQPVTLQDLLEVPAKPTGAQMFVESLGEAGCEFKRSMASTNLEEVLVAEKAIAKASPLLRSGGSGGILHYRHFYLNDPHLRFWTGLVLLEHRNHVQAASEFGAAKSLGFNHWRAEWYLAECAKRRGDLAEAETLLQKVLHAAPEFRAALIATEQMRQPGDETDSFPLLLEKAERSYNGGDLASAANALGRALQMEPHNRSALKMLGDLNHRQERYSDAAQVYGRLLKQTPNDGEVLLLLGNSFYKAGDKDAAETVFARVLELDPTNKVARENLSVLRGRRFESAPSPVISAETQTGNRPLVSAIVSTYNSEKFIRGCLQDLVDQTLFQKGQLEIVVIDSGSEQNERAVVEEFRLRHPNIVYQRTERETLYAAWNRAIRLARGRYITPANTDDRHRHDALEVMARVLEAQKAGLVYADVLLTSFENETFRTTSAQRVWEHPNYSLRQALMHGPFGPKNMWPRALHDDLGWFDPSFTIAGDYELFLRLARKHGAHHINEVLGLYYESQKNLSYGDQDKVIEEISRLLKHHRQLIPIEEVYPFLQEDRSAIARVAALVDWANLLAWQSLYPGLELAEQMYREALSLAGPRMSGISNNLALLSYRLGRKDEAICRLRELAAFEPIALENVRAIQEDKMGNLRLFRVKHSKLDDLIPVWPVLGKRIPISDYQGKHFQAPKASHLESSQLTSRSDLGTNPCTNPNEELASRAPAGVEKAPSPESFTAETRERPTGADHSSSLNSTPVRKRPMVLWLAPFYDSSGYADEARNFAINLDLQGCDLAIRSNGRPSEQFRSQMRASARARLDALLQKRISRPLILVIHSPAYTMQRSPESVYYIGRTMFEADGLPQSWVRNCNQMDEIWVPSELALECIRNTGVTARLTKIPEGVEVERFRPGSEPLSIPGARKTVFLSVFEWIYRKGWDVLLRAWAKAFNAGDDVSLVLRSYPMNATDYPDANDELEKRIHDYLKRSLGLSRREVAPIILLKDQIPDANMPRLYSAARAYVSPSRGEGWGRTSIEAMACGLPTVATAWGGNREFMTSENSLLIDYQMVEVDQRCEIHWYHGHRWAEPSWEHLAHLLRRVVAEPNQMNAIGQRARQDVVQHWSWDRVAALAKKRLDEIQVELERRREGAATVSSAKENLEAIRGTRPPAE